MPNKYDIGHTVTVLTQWTDPESTPTPDEPFDPAVVKCDVRSGSGTITTYTYPTSPQIRKLGVGNYACDILGTVKGDWSYRWYSTGDEASAKEGLFQINATKAVATT